MIKKPKCSVCPDDVKSIPKDLRKYQTGGKSKDVLYNIGRAKELGYEPDETGHMPSVDETNGMWLKSKKHPTANKELMAYTLNLGLQRQLKHPIVNQEGYFGDDQLQYQEKTLPKDLKKYQVGGPVPTMQDSLFLLNNNKQIAKLIASGYTKTRDQELKKPPYSSVKEAQDQVQKIYKEDVAEGFKVPSKDKYMSTYGNLVGTSDWVFGGGDDKGMPRHFVHPNIVPQYQADFSDNRTENTRPSVFTYGYDDLAITPWSKLSEEDKAKRLKLYGKAGTPQDPKWGIKEVITKESSASKLDKKDYLSIPVRSPNAAPLKESNKPLKVREIPKEKPAMVDQNFSSNVLLRILKKPYGYTNRGDGKGMREKK